MVTIKDIARAAGVAHGTVSNVLNGRGNVSSEKIKLVQEACEALGYVPNERAKTLRSGHGRLLGVLLPDMNIKWHRNFFLSFKAYAEDHGYTVRQYIPRAYGKDAEEAAVREAQSDMAVGIAIFSSCHQAEHERSGIPGMIQLYVERRIPGAANYIGFDYEQAGRDMARRIAEKKYAQATLITGSLRHPNESAFYNGFLSGMKDTPCSITTLQTDSHRMYLNIIEASEQGMDQAIVCSQLEFAKAAKNVLQTFAASKLPDIYTLSPIYTLPESDFIKYELNYRQLGYTAARQLIRELERGQEPGVQILKNTGFRCWDAAPPASRSAPRPLNVVTLESPTAYAMRNMARLYTRQTGIPVNVTIYSYDATYEVFNNMSEDSVFDVIRLDVTWLSWFAQKLMLPLTQIDPGVEKDLSAFLAGTPERYAYVGDTLYALPGSPSMQMLFYRRDLFQSAIYRRLFQEQYKTELAVPQTFDEFNRVASFFTRKLNPDSPVDYGATLTLGSTGVAGSEYLARLFSVQENLYGPDGKVSLNSPTAVRALEQLLELKPYTGPHYCSWWTDTAKAFADGNVAMAMLYNNFAAPLVGRHSKVLDDLGYAMIPGGNPNIGGGALGVSKYSRQPENALGFIRWLLSEPIASASALLGGISPCKASYDNYELVNTYPWLKLINRRISDAHGRRTPPGSSTPFDERRFMSILGMAVKNAHSGAVPAQQAMDRAQKQYEEQFEG